MLSAGLASATSFAQQPSKELVRVDRGAISDSQLQAIQFDETASTATFHTDDGETRLPLSQLVRWGHPAPPSAPLLLLSDGSRLAAIETLQPLRIHEDQLQADTALFGDMAIPLEQLQGIALNLPDDPHQRRILLDALRPASDPQQIATDRLLLQNGDELAGTIVTWEDGLIEMISGGQTSKIATGQVTAVVFNPALARKLAPAPRQVLIGFADGTLLAASRLSTKVKRQLQISTVLDRTLVAKLEKVVYLQPLGFEVRYLSDLPAAGYKHVPFLDREWEYRRDANVLGGPLAAGGHEYHKGLGMHSPARITYRTDGKYARLQGSLAIDDATGNRGSVTCRVYIDDGGGQWKSVYASEVIRGGQAPVPVDVDITGARQVSLLIDYADRGDQLDRVNWLDARFVP